ncbi:MAG: NAD(P)/FAD-dependent oxidoreductase [Kiritimatiellae bacterium]|nr:NAD(P)/FAD-dependent oxidoreductase [Kiritimatiellia bacterium]
MKTDSVKNRQVQLAIVGGGAAGMFAASVAADLRLGAVLIERKARLGSKVLMTANGRCNFTKDISPDRFLADVGPCAKFVAKAIRECPPRRIADGFKSLHVPVRRMADGRLFPADGKATTIVHAFGDLLRDTETPIITNCPVTAVEQTHGGFAIVTKNFTLEAKNVLIATGGVSYPKLGSVGDGQKFAKSLGHSIVPYRPGLIGLETADPRIVRRAGRRYEDGRAKVCGPDGTVLFDYRGEVDCEQFGLSGAAVYNSQRFIEHAGLKDWEIEVWFDRERLRFRNLKPRPVKEAIVTIGGVALDDVNPETMESKIVPGLYFAGEVLDIDGPTGGYNLTLAFATARLAVASAAARWRITSRPSSAAKTR